MLPPTRVDGIEPLRASLADAGARPESIVARDARRVRLDANHAEAATPTRVTADRPAAQEYAHSRAADASDVGRRHPAARDARAASQAHGLAGSRLQREASLERIVQVKRLSQGN